VVWLKLKNFFNLQVLFLTTWQGFIAVHQAHIAKQYTKQVPHTHNNTY